MFKQVTAFLTQNNLLDSNQSGFRSGHSTETALLSVVEDLRLARTASKSSLIILLDLSAASRFKVLLFVTYSIIQDIIRDGGANVFL